MSNRSRSCQDQINCNEPLHQPQQRVERDSSRSRQERDPFRFQSDYLQNPPATTQNLTDSGQLAQVLDELTDRIAQNYMQGKQPKLYRQVVTIPGQPGRVLQAFRRLPNVSQDVFQRIYVVKPQRDVIDLLISVPNQPSGTHYSEKTLYARPHRPLIKPRLVQTTMPTNIPYQSFNTDQVNTDPTWQYSSMLDQSNNFSQDCIYDPNLDDLAYVNPAMNVPYMNNQSYMNAQYNTC